MACPNEVHDVLYSKARVVLNNNVKRLWFKINPFLERKDTLKGFTHPEQLSKFVKLLQSSVVCEQYFTEESATFQGVTVEEFWGFLYSDKWASGCSIRILEGQLLDYLLTALYVLEKTMIINHNNTFAFAKNQRERRGCYKLSNELKGCTVIEETLLLEFTYYGRKAEKMQKETSSTQPYPETTTDSTFQTITEAEDDLKPIEILSKSRRRKKSVFQYKFDPFSSHSFKRNSMFVSSDQSKETSSQMEDIARRLDYMVRSGCISDEKDELETTLKGWMERESVKTETEKSNIEVIPHIPSDETRSSQASTDSDYKLKPRLLNLNRLTCTEKVTYGDEVDIDTVNDINTLESFDTGEEFYLGENVWRALSEDLTAQDKLRKRLKEKQKNREETKVHQKMWEERRLASALPKYEEIDFSLLDNLKKASRRLPVRAPTFEEFLNILDEEEKYDPRFRRAKQMTKRIAKRYNIQKEALRSKRSLLQSFDDKKVEDAIILPPISRKPDYNQGRYKYGRRHTMAFAEEVGGVTDSKACQNWVVSQDKGKRRSPPKRRLNTITDDYDRERSVSVDYGSTLDDFDIYRSPPLILEIPALFLTTPSGTISELDRYDSDDQSEIIDNITPKIAASKASIQSTGPVKKDKSRTMKKSSARMNKSRKSSVKAKMSRRKEIVEENESSSESEPEYEPQQDLFDTKKLNLKYSFERLRGKQVKKKPSFYEVLKKFYKIQRVVNKFQGGTPKKKGGRRRGIFARLINAPLEESRDESPPVGKMKRFDFLDHKPPKLDEEEAVSFATVSMLEFTAKVLQSLDDFVVRKEQVVSNYCLKTSKTITFTRKAVFKMK